MNISSRREMGVDGTGGGAGGLQGFPFYDQVLIQQNTINAKAVLSNFILAKHSALPLVSINW